MEIVEQVPDERIAWRTIRGDVDQAGVVAFHKLDDATTRVMIRIDWLPADAVEKAGAAVGVDDRVAGDAKRFKDFIESRGQETGDGEARLPNLWRFGRLASVSGRSSQEGSLSTGRSSWSRHRKRRAIRRVNRHFHRVVA